jgi:hypothetical protein
VLVQPQTMGPPVDEPRKNKGDILLLLFGLMLHVAAMRFILGLAHRQAQRQAHQEVTKE